MNIITSHRYTAVPASWIPNSVNYVAVNADVMEVYVANSQGVPRRVLNEEDVQVLIDAAVAQAGGVTEVADIAARDALTPDGVIQVYVSDAQGDPTVDSGGAFYLYRPSDSSWKKTGEDESLDLVLNWDSIQGGPSSTPAAIDAAVGNSHVHANKTEIDQISQNAEGEPLYAGQLIRPHWATEAW